MTQMILQNLSLFFAGLVLLTVLLRYNNTEYNEYLKNFVRGTIEPGLAFLFSFYGFYLWYCIHRGIILKKDASMYKTFGFAVGISAMIATCWDFQSNVNTGWTAAAEHVARPVASASFFVLPLLLVSPVE